MVMASANGAIRRLKPFKDFKRTQSNVQKKKEQSKAIKQMT